VKVEHGKGNVGRLIEESATCIDQFSVFVIDSDRQAWMHSWTVPTLKLVCREVFTRDLPEAVMHVAIRL
jgi:hypothetical protein